ncbi:IS66 C-terminal element [Desulfosporosinus hippei DSM 8344]|uniref:IS66 C-terminal element n=1 Tax=Desulfosporosinus hippei DSM 8344 TaxID=1121419 RepID=A0A1G8L443_9FIRM|nr:IS66 C-terminal element [Desulfosporosinus hippei DSM 8344]
MDTREATRNYRLNHWTEIVRECRSSGQTVAVYSMIESAKANGLNPYKYLCFIFRELPRVQFGQYPEFLEDYLPWSPDVQAVLNRAKT